MLALTRVALLYQTAIFAPFCAKTTISVDFALNFHFLSYKETKQLYGYLMSEEWDR